MRVELANERLVSLNANSGSGDVAVEAASIEVELSANSGSGDVSALVLEASSPGKARLNSGSGDILLVVPGNIVGSFDLETHSGEVDVPRALGLVVKKDVSGQTVARGTAGSGGGKYKLSSGSGDLTVMFGNALPAKDE